jgi:hypothetical protein
LHLTYFCCYSCFNSIVRGEPQVMGLKDFLEVCLGFVHMVSYWASIMFSNMSSLSGSNPRAKNLWLAPLTNPGVNEKLVPLLWRKGLMTLKCVIRSFWNSDVQLLQGGPSFN